jgi:hypothetical protein
MVTYQTYCHQKLNKIQSQHIRLLRNKRPQHHRLQRQLQKRRHNRIPKTNPDFKPLWQDNDHT